MLTRWVVNPGNLRIVVGVVLVVLSAVPWGIAEGRVIAMERLYKAMPVLYAGGLLLLAFGMYFLGFVIAPINVVIVAAVWEISAVVSAIVTAGEDRAFTWEKGLWFVVVASGIVVISAGGHKLYELYKVP